MFKSIFETIICGGPVMLPIIIVSIVVWMLIIEKYLYLRKKDIDYEEFFNDIFRLIKERNKKEAIKICEKFQDSVAEGVKRILENGSKGKERLQRIARQIFHEKYPELDEHLPTISTLAQISPLLGLLGTVGGMVSTFTTINLFGTGDPQSLAKGISQSLITTQSGLIVAIPALFLHNHLAKKVDFIINNLEKSITGLINLLSKEENE
ncbi:MAG: hypothetical protein DRI36_02780 [Caldiserica bacterium]|nr:MAG: hypothetical protein DRI36_02780 [Caldisericota bacterium]